jgi:hypothetical protein
MASPSPSSCPLRSSQTNLFGYMVGKVKIAGDIVGPITPLEDWENK